MISYGKQSIDQSDIDAVVEVLKGNWLTQGPEIETFENNLKDYFGSNHTCAIANGTAALHLTGLALGWQPGDVVITSSITFLATANCIVYAGATPDFVDIDPVSYTIDPNRVEYKIKAYQLQGIKVKAVIGVDYAGHPVELDAILGLAEKNNLVVIEDAAHALGAEYKSRRIGSLSHMTTFSFHPVKHITTGEGGMVTTDNPEFARRLRMFRTRPGDALILLNQVPPESIEIEFIRPFVERPLEIAHHQHPAREDQVLDRELSPRLRLYLLRFFC